MKANQKYQIVKTIQRDQMVGNIVNTSNKQIIMFPVCNVNQKHIKSEEKVKNVYRD